MCYGRVDTELRPHYQTYQARNWESEVRDYNETMRKFYEEQDMQNPSWSQTVAQRVATKESLGTRQTLRQALEERDFGLK